MARSPIPSCFSLDQSGAVFRGLKFDVLGSVLMNQTFELSGAWVKVFFWFPRAWESEVQVWPCGGTYCRGSCSQR